MIRGYWLPVLHSHLPFVKHPEHEYFLEEHWLFEAITESYIPLLINMKQLVEEEIEFRLTLSLAPPLMEMLSDKQLMEKYEIYLYSRIQLAELESERLKKDTDFLPLALFYKERLNQIKSFFTGVLNSDILQGYRHFRDLGKLEVITSCATHGFLPLLKVNQKAVEAQVSLAVDSFIGYFGGPPEGMWLPECAYYEGLDRILNMYGIRYFFLDSEGLMSGDPVPRYSVYAPVYTAAGVAAFGRDPLSSKQVWSTHDGYPGDYQYRDFYRDAGYDLDFDYIKPFISPDGTRVFTGIKYYRITGRSDAKEPYNLQDAADKVIEHAVHFHDERVAQIKTVAPMIDRQPVVVSPYDAELFGHWWFEGPDFLYRVFREIHEKKEIRSITPSEYLKLYPENQVIAPSPSSWGYRGYYDVWLNEDNDWIYRHLHYMADRLEELASASVQETDTLKIRLLNQMTRELLLAQSSDWAFLMSTNTAREYSSARTKEHIKNFNRLVEWFSSGNIDVSELEWMERKHSIFAFLDFRVFADR